MTSIFKVAGFTAFLLALFINSFVDIGHKVLLQNTIYKTYDGELMLILITTINALMLVPFILLFTPAGYVADKYPKEKVMRFFAWIAIILTSLITLGYFMGWFWFSFWISLAMAAQSAMYTPAKFAYIYEIAGKKRLMQGNSMVQAGSLIAILTAMIAFSVLFEQQLAGKSWDTTHDILMIIAPLGGLLVACSILELILLYRLPQFTQTKKRHFDWMGFIKGKQPIKYVKEVVSNRAIFACVIGLTTYWTVAQLIISSYPNFAKNSLQLENTAVVQGIQALMSVGFLIGSILVGKISRNHIETSTLPLAAISLTFLVFMIPLFDSVLIQASIFVISGIASAFFITPLYSILQYHAEGSYRSRTLATSTLIQFSVMLFFLLTTAFLASTGFNELFILITAGILALIGSTYSILKTPQSILRFLLPSHFRKNYRLHIKQFENIPATGGILFTAQITSTIDWLIVQIACPRRIHFFTPDKHNIYIPFKWLRRFFEITTYSSVGSNNNAIISKAAKQLNQGQAVCLLQQEVNTFNKDAAFHHIYESLSHAAAQNRVIPFVIKGCRDSSSFTEFQNLTEKNQVKKARQKGIIPKNIYITFAAPLDITLPMKQLKRNQTNLSFQQWQNFAATLPSIPQRWLCTAKNKNIPFTMTDATGVTIERHRFMTAVFLFASKIKKLSPEKHIGILLPASNAAAITNMATLTLGKTVVNLNFTAGQDALRSAVQQADIKTIYTARKFTQKLLDKGIHIEDIFRDTKLIYLEDIKAQISKAASLNTYIQAKILPTRLLQWMYLTPVKQDDTAAILFSSGSEGHPKGIKLSHKNLSANARQVEEVLMPPEHEVIMATLPTFHSFGLLVTTLMPLSEGIPIVCHPDPTDVLNIAKAIKKYDATLFFGTSTFFRMYIRNSKIKPDMLQSLRLIVAGAEKLRSDVSEGFKKKFDKQILEGYGATETSPVASVNFPDLHNETSGETITNNKIGSVGRPVPGTLFRIIDPETCSELPIGEDGMILIGGPQVMKGYLNQPEKTAAVIHEIDGYRWYESGDKGHLDEQGFLTIVDRYSRFAKLGGEMISLTAVEDAIRNALQTPEIELLAVNTPDAKKGEKIVLLVTDEKIEQAQLRKTLLAAEINPLMYPASLIHVEQIPKLGSGKTDFSAAKTLALNAM